MHYLEIPEKNLTLYLPENLGECDAKQYAEMAKLMYWLFVGQITYQDFKTLAVYALLNMKHHKKNANDEKVNEEIFKISEASSRVYPISFLFSFKNCNNSFKSILKASVSCINQ